MIRVLLMRFWPVFLPLLLYVLWMWRRRVRARKLGHDVPPFTEGPLGWVTIVTLLLLIIGFIYWGVIAEPTEDGHYIPPQMENGEIMPGHVEP